MGKPKQLSPFSLQFWINKGMSPDEAEFKRNSIRPIRKEYWLVRGHDDETSERLALEAKKKNNLRGAMGSKSRTLEQQRESSHRCKEYWIARGMSLVDAQVKASEVQRSFTLEKCIEKHGIDRGTEIWRTRQEKWQNTLNSKTSEEKLNINTQKNACSLKNFSNVDSAISILKRKRNMTLFASIEQLIEHLANSEFIAKPYLKYSPVEYFVTKLSKVQREIFGASDEELSNALRPYFSPTSKFLMKHGKYRARRAWVGTSLLRSSYEIFFYELFTTKFPNAKIEIDGCYPDSMFRFDFKIGDIYVEISPMYHTHPKVQLKIDKKVSVFGCVVLSDCKEITKFIEDYECNTN
jgi:hypothetical protein